VFVKDGFPMIFRFHYRKDKRLYGCLFSIKEVLNCPLIPPVINNSKDKYPEDKNTLVFRLNNHYC